MTVHSSMMLLKLTVLTFMTCAVGGRFQSVLLPVLVYHDADDGTLKNSSVVQQAVNDALDNIDLPDGLHINPSYHFIGHTDVVKEASTPWSFLDNGAFSSYNDSVSYI